ncbi:hypothetical protein ACHAAC_17145 [Aeromicrobium sp. CF4.19]|uniref:hypothetical protein n=1 Tax=Aeromicrobium sp. CF4.19 TaxID=3373082 RepID=UPI003EE472DD
MNPFDGINPSFGPFTGLLESRLGVLLALAWAIAFVFCAWQLIVAVAKLSRAKSGGYGNDLDESRNHAFWAGGAVIILVALPAIFGVLVSV